MKKYKLRKDLSLQVGGRILYRVEYLIDSEYFKKGELGGYIEKEENLSHYGNCAVSDNARVYGNAGVYGNAWVSGSAQVFGSAWVYGDAQVYGNAWVSSNAHVYGTARVSGSAQVFGNAYVYGNAQVSGNAWVYGNAQVYGDAQVYDNAWVYGNAQVYGNALVYGNARACFYLELDKSGQLINITGLKYKVTVTYCYVQVGCKFYMLDEIDDVTYDSVKGELSEEEFYDTKYLIDIGLNRVLSNI